MSRESRETFSRRGHAARFPIALLCAVASLPGGSPRAAEPAEAPKRAAVELVTPQAEQAVERGLKWLAGKQHEDGSFGTRGYRGNVAICGLAGMAFMAGGSTPGRGPYGEEVSRCVDYILANTQRSGFITTAGSASHGPMYGHGFATLFLAECYGSSRRPELREKLAAAVKLIVNSQNHEGGWRYQPKRADADISVTICQVMALRAARNAGLYVPSETIDRCIAYVKRCQNSDGGWAYMSTGGPSEFPRSAAGVVALYSAGVYEGPEITSGLDYLMRSLPNQGDVRRQEGRYFYGHYYAVQAMWHAGGDYWRKWYPAIRDELVNRQREDGAWMSSIGLEYGAAMACIVLQVPEDRLPIFQR